MMMVCSDADALNRPSSRSKREKFTNISEEWERSCLLPEKVDEGAAMGAIATPHERMILYG